MTWDMLTLMPAPDRLCHSQAKHRVDCLARQKGKTQIRHVQKQEDLTQKKMTLNGDDRRLLYVFLFLFKTFPHTWNSWGVPSVGLHPMQPF